MRKALGLGLLLGALLLAGCGQDTVKPSVTITAPQNGATVNQDTLTVQGTAQDNVRVNRVTYQLNNGQEQEVPITPGTSVNFAFTLTLPQGQNTITVHAYDPSGNKGTASVQVTYDPQAVHTLSGYVVRRTLAVPWPDTLKLYRGGALVATTTTASDGSFTFTNLAPGTYRLRAQKPGMAGSLVEGIRVPEMASITLVQKPAFDATATTTPPTLLITQDGNIPLEGGIFTDVIPFRVQVDTSKDYVRPMRYIYVALGRTPGSAFVTNSATWTRRIFTDTEDTGNQALSGSNVAGFGDADGENVYLEVVAYDFNENRSHYILPITFINTNPTQANTVQAPTQVAATAITLTQAVGFYGVKAPAKIQVPVAKGQVGELALDPMAVPEEATSTWRCAGATPTPPPRRSPLTLSAPPTAPTGSGWAPWAVGPAPAVPATPSTAPSTSATPLPTSPPARPTTTGWWPGARVRPKASPAPPHPFRPSSPPSSPPPTRAWACPKPRTS